MRKISTLAALPLLVVVGLAWGAAPAAADAGLEVRYVANEGFLVDGDGKRVLVDGLFGAGVVDYPVAPPEARERLEQGLDEWQGIDVALATHYHPDHFDPDSVARFLRANPASVFVSTPQAVRRIEERYPDEAALLGRTRAVLPAPATVETLEIHGVGIAVLNLHHGARQPPVDNLGFVVTLGDLRFLHFGDTEAKMVDFEPYLELLRGTDLGLLPFWFLSSAWRAEMVRDRIGPRWIVVGHLPLPTAPAARFARWHSYDHLVTIIRDAFPDAHVPRAPGDSYRFAG